ncbi:hypothetical protein [Pseudomonas chlororaphis]|uniref:hypothetical protein n=1 Tax=Pseudomonas chlororaphis TaxID=587753 RepID=UPI000F57AE97|nr:hypothetical protein [Pseudomonas chlororaphis]
MSDLSEIAITVFLDNEEVRCVAIVLNVVYPGNGVWLCVVLRHVWGVFQTDAVRGLQHRLALHLVAVLQGWKVHDEVLAPPGGLSYKAIIEIYRLRRDGHFSISTEVSMLVISVHRDRSAAELPMTSYAFACQQY